MKLPVETIMKSGLLSEINRKFLHPLGLALIIELPCEHVFVYDYRNEHKPRKRRNSAKPPDSE